MLAALGTRVALVVFPVPVRDFLAMGTTTAVFSAMPTLAGVTMVEAFSATPVLAMAAMAEVSSPTPTTTLAPSALLPAVGAFSAMVTTTMEEAFPVIASTIEVPFSGSPTTSAVGCSVAPKL